jgi:hypothetical protein
MLRNADELNEGLLFGSSVCTQHKRLQSDSIVLSCRAEKSFVNLFKISNTICN